jgi:hypothetical protein
MFELVALLSTLLSVAAFKPASINVRSSALKMSYETELGVQAPAGFFDPLGKILDFYNLCF